MNPLVFTLLLAATGCADSLEPYQQRDVDLYFDQPTSLDARRADTSDTRDTTDPTDMGAGLCLCTLFEHGVPIAKAIQSVPSNATCDSLDWKNPPFAQDCR